MEHLGNHLCPPVDKVVPAIFDVQVPAFRLLVRLLFEKEISSVIDLPNKGVLGKNSLIGQGTAGSILAKARCINNERVLFQRRKQCIVIFERTIP